MGEWCVCMCMRIGGNCLNVCLCIYLHAFYMCKYNECTYKHKLSSHQYKGQSLAYFSDLIQLSLVIWAKKKNGRKSGYIYPRLIM